MRSEDCKQLELEPFSEWSIPLHPPQFRLGIIPSQAGLKKSIASAGRGKICRSGAGPNLRPERLARWLMAFALLTMLVTMVGAASAAASSDLYDPNVRVNDN